MSNQLMQKEKQKRRPPGVKLRKGQAYPVIEEYFRSGLMPLDFYTKVGWSSNQFFSWRKRYMEEHNMLTEESESPTFHPIAVNSPVPLIEEKKEDNFSIEITYPNGVTLRLSSQNMVQLVDLIKLY